MSFFDFFKSKPTLRTESIALRNLDPDDANFCVYVAAAIDNGTLVYFNNNIPSNLFSYRNFEDGTDFNGRLFKIEMTLRGNKRFDIFYAIPTDDPHGLLMTMTSQAYINIGVPVVRTLLSKYPDILDLRGLIDSQTRWAYHLSHRNDGSDWLISNNFGSDCYYIHGTQIQHGIGSEMAKIYRRA